MDAESEILDYLGKKNNLEYLEIVNKTKQFLSGFYSPFGLELLSTIDFLTQKNQTIEKETKNKIVEDKRR